MLTPAGTSKTSPVSSSTSNGVSLSVGAAGAGLEVLDVEVVLTHQWHGQALHRGHEALRAAGVDVRVPGEPAQGPREDGGQIVRGGAEVEVDLLPEDLPAFEQVDEGGVLAGAGEVVELEALPVAA